MLSHTNEKASFFHYLIFTFPAICQVGSAHLFFNMIKSKHPRQTCMSSLYVAELSDVVWVTCAPLTQSTFRSHNFLFHLQTHTARRLRTVAVPSLVHKSRVICVSFTFESHPHIHTSIRQIWFIHFPTLTPLYMTLGDERRVMEIFHSGDMNRKCHRSIILAFIVAFLEEIPVVWGKE